MYNSFLFILLLFGINKASCQAKQQGVQQAIDNLSWRSFQVTPTYAPQIKIDKQAASIVSSANRTTQMKLLAALADSNKTAISHILLSQIAKDKGRLGAAYPVQTGLDSLVRYVYNGLVWFKDYNGRQFLDRNSADSIRQQWQVRLAKP